MSIFSLQGLSTTFEGSTNVSYNKNLFTFVTNGKYKQYSLKSIYATILI